MKARNLGAYGNSVSIHGANRIVDERFRDHLADNMIAHVA